MFWTSDAYSTRRTHSIDSSSLRYTSKQLENDDKNHQLQTKNNQDKINLSEKVSKFLAVNKQHQFDQVCVCEDCIYAKQLNRYQALKMDLSKMSSYRAQYNKNHLKKNFSNTENLKDSSISKKPEDGNMSKNPYVHIDSVYKNEYASRSLQKVQKPRPSDQLKFTGPSTSFSSYKALYPNINGPYQYMQPSKQQALPNLKFKAQSLYTNDFKGNRVVETESAKINDQLKLGKPSLIKESTNKRQFSNPQNSFIMSDRYNSSRQRRLQTPNFSFQYKTINRDEFEKPASKKNCRNKRMQILHGQMLASQNMSTIA